MTGDRVWSRWRASASSVLRRIAVNSHDLVMRVRGTGHHAECDEGTAVTPAHVLRVLLQHEFAKHSGAGEAAISECDEQALADLLHRAGWPSRRVRRILRLQWRWTSLEAHRLAEIQLAPVPWVLRLGGGSNRAAAVARGVQTALEAGEQDVHVSAVRRTIEEPPHPRVLVLRYHRGGLIVEDGNHFVVGLLLRFPDPEQCPLVPCLIGRHPARRSAQQDRQGDGALLR